MFFVIGPLWFVIVMTLLWLLCSPGGLEALSAFSKIALFVFFGVSIVGVIGALAFSYVALFETAGACKWGEDYTFWMIPLVAAWLCALFVSCCWRWWWVVGFLVSMFLTAGLVGNHFADANPIVETRLDRETNERVEIQLRQESNKAVEDMLQRNKEQAAEADRDMLSKVQAKIDEDARAASSDRISTARTLPDVVKIEEEAHGPWVTIQDAQGQHIRVEVMMISSDGELLTYRTQDGEIGDKPMGYLRKSVQQAVRAAESWRAKQPSPTSKPKQR